MTDTVASSLTGSETGIAIAAGDAAQFLLTGLAPHVAGVTQHLTVKAEDFYGNVATSYPGTIHFTSSDPNAILPPDSTLTNGVGTFNVILNTIGTQSVTVSDTTVGGPTGSETGIPVTVGPVSQFAVTGLTADPAGTAQSVTVTAEDAGGNPVAGYSGTVYFTSTDPAAVLPADSTLINGVGTFSVTLETAGTQSVTATDLEFSSITGTESGITVNQASTTTVLTSSDATSVYGESVTFTATVTASGTPTGTVTFYAGAVNPADQIGTGTLSVVDGQDEATFSTSTLTVSGSPHTITAVYGGDANFLSGSSATTQTVNPAAISLTIANDSQTYGTAANLATDLGATIATGVNNENLDIAYSSTGDTATAHAGTYDITGALSNGTGLLSDYTVTLTPGTLTVNPYALSYTIGNDSQTYGTAANLATDLGATIATGVNNENLDIAYSSTGDTATAHAGTYDITGALSNGTGLLSDYTVTLTPGTLTVNPYALSYTIANDSQTYGTAANLATDLGATIATGVNNENLDIAYSSTGDTATADAGTYDITGALSNGTGLLSDYTVTLTPGTLTVNPYALSYTIGNDSQTYGTAANLATDLGATIATGVNDENLDIAYSSTGDTATAHAGTYDITGALSNGTGLLSDYTVTLTPGTLTVNPYALSYTIANDSQTYGTAADLATDLGATIATGVNNENLDIAYSSTGDTATADVGTYDITGTLSNGTGLLSDYTVTLTPGTLTVNPYALSYTIGNDSQTYGTRGQPGHRPGCDDRHWGQQREPGHRLQQHGRHGHGPRRHLRHHRRLVERHRPAQRLHRHAHPRHADGQPVCPQLHDRQRQPDLRHRGQPRHRPGDHDRHRGQRPGPGHRLQQHRRHGHGPRRHLRDRRSLVEWHRPAQRLHRHAHPRHADGQQVRPQLHDRQRQPDLRHRGQPGHRPGCDDRHWGQRREPGHRLQQQRRHGHGPRRHLRDHRRLVEWHRPAQRLHRHPHPRHADGQQVRPQLPRSPTTARLTAPRPTSPPTWEPRSTPGSTTRTWTSPTAAPATRSRPTSAPTPSPAPCRMAPACSATTPSR